MGDAGQCWRRWAGRAAHEVLRLVALMAGLLVYLRATHSIEALFEAGADPLSYVRLGLLSGLAFSPAPLLYTAWQERGRERYLTCLFQPAIWSVAAWLDLRDTFPGQTAPPLEVALITFGVMWLTVACVTGAWVWLAWKFRRGRLRQAF